MKLLFSQIEAHKRSIYDPQPFFTFADPNSIFDYHPTL